MTGNIQNISNIPETCETHYYFFLFQELARAQQYISNHHTTVEKQNVWIDRAVFTYI